MAKTRSVKNDFVIDFKAILCKMRFEYPIQYNKDWNNNGTTPATGWPVFEYPIQYNKDWNWVSLIAPGCV